MAAGDIIAAFVERLRTNRRIERHARIVEVHAMSTSAKLAVVEFAGQTLLLSVARDGVSLIAKGDAQ